MSSSSSSVVSLSSFNLLFFTQVLTVLTSSIKYNEYVTDKGKNISIPCIAEGDIMWVKDEGNSSTIIQTGKFLVFTNVTVADRGLYVCFASVPLSNATDIALVVEDDDVTTDSAATSAATHSNSDDTSRVANVVSDNVSVTTKTNSVSSPTVTVTSPPPHQSINAATTSSATSPLLPTPSATTISALGSNNTTTNTTTFTTSSTPTYRVEEREFRAAQKINLRVRTTPGPVTQLYFKASTILGFLIWRFNKTSPGDYPVRSFTAEFRNISYKVPPFNSSYEHEWSRMDPINIAPNVRQMEVYRLEPNTTYEFRIWANNQLGSGEVVTTNVTTLPETKEEAAFESGWDGIELIPNIILNPGFCESDGQESPFTRQLIFGRDDESDSYESESDHEPKMEKFKRKVSVFFQGPTIKRI